MKQKTVQKQKKKKKEIVIISRKERQELLLKLFRKHIGRDKAITQKQIFEYVYGSVENYSDLQIFYLWSRMKIDMNWIRKTTKCFIASKPVGAVWKYYVVKDKEDAEPYIKTLQNNIKKSQYMIKRCYKAVEEAFWEEL